MNIVLDIHWTNFWFDCLQAIITGAIGAVSAWIVNSLLKKFEKYYKKKKNGRYRTTSY
jgi:H+/Cl- antiporter ClcA